MNKYPDARRLIAKRLIPIHRFDVGAKVLCDALNGPLFVVTKLLPDGGQGLQYRIKSFSDGRERVATESMLKLAARPGLLEARLTKH
jgi:hypothetical protein